MVPRLATRHAEPSGGAGSDALAFDASYQGDSGGDPHHLEDPAARVQDVRAAVDYLQTLGYVDADRIGVLGICAGGGYAVNAIMTDHRVRAVPTVSGLNIGAAWRRGWYGTYPDSAAGSLCNTTELHARVRSPRRLVIVDGGTHMDFYDVPKHVDRAVAEATPLLRGEPGRAQLTAKERAAGVRDRLNA